MAKKICKNCAYNKDQYGFDNINKNHFILCTRFIPHISNCKIKGNPNNERVEVILRKSEIQVSLLKPNNISDMPYLLINDDFGCNYFKEKN